MELEVAIYAAIVVATLFAVILILWITPRFFAPSLREELLRKEGVQTARERRELQEARLRTQNDLRTTLLQALAGLALALGAVIAWQTFQADRDRHLTERFTQAIEQLGQDSTSVRTGGIYALEVIGKIDVEQATTVVEILAVYVRERASLPTNDAGVVDNTVYKTASTTLAVRAPDVQAAMTVLGRRQEGIIDELTLGQVDLSRSDLRDADLRGANLRGINLRGAYLRRAKLQGAELHNADLTGGDLRDANLDSAELDEATLTGATANLKTTWPDGFDFHGAGVRLV